MSTFFRHFLLVGILSLGFSRLWAAVPAITSATSATAQVGVAFSYQIAASNTPTSFNATGLPAGLAVNTASGLISGTPTTAATSIVTLSATNASGTGTKAITLKVNPATPVISSATSASGQVGVAFTYQITAGNTPTSYSATGLPAGLSINGTTGAISGRPTAAGNYSATINAKNAGGTGTATLAITVVPAVPVISSPATATSQVGIAFSYQIAASNTPTSYSATGLPTGLSVDSTAGLITGTPTTAGVSPISLSATNAGGTGSKALTLTVNPATPVISSATTANGQVGVTFSYQIVASNTPTSYSASGLPAGLSVNATTGVIAGKPTVVGNFSATINAKNAGGTGTATLAISVIPAIPVISSATTAKAQVGVAFSYQIVASNTPTSFDAPGLPAGLSVDTGTGLISGTPTTAAVSPVTLSATNAGGTGTKVLTLTVNPATPVISSATTASGQVGVTFSYQIVASNTPTSYSASGLPAGLSVNATTGVIAGKPTVVGNFSATINAKNAGGTGTASLAISVIPAIPVISSATTAKAQVGVAFSYQIAASNTPTSFDAPGLPAGLSVDTVAGLISGTPTTAGVSAVTLSATNAGGTGTKALTLTVNPATPVISSATTANGQVGVAFTYQIVASNTPTSYSGTGLPAGLSVNATTGAVSGKPTAAGSFSATINAKNAGGTGSATLTISVLPAVPVINSATSLTGQVGVALTYRITATGTPTSFNATGLPAGLTVDPTTGAITGTPTVAATSTVVLSATNAGGTGIRNLTLKVNPDFPVINSPATATGQVGVAFTYQITATFSPTSYAATGLPAGLTLNTATGVISGTPTTAGASTVRLSAKNALGTGTANLALTVVVASPVITSPATAAGQVGVAFTYQIAATNAPTGYGATALPPGLTVNPATGVISGTPTTAGTSTATLSATNAGGTGTAALTLGINPAQPVIGGSSATTGQVGVAFSYQITASNNPTSYGATGLPAGLTIDPTTGLISGTPTTPGTSTVTITATNAGGTVSSTITLTILAALPYVTDFEAGDGFIAGPLGGQLGWVVGQGTATVTTTDFSLGAQSVQLPAGTPPALISQAFAPGAGETVEFFDFFARPVAETDPSQATTFQVEGAKFGFALGNAQGVLQYFSGNGTGGGAWAPTTFSLPLGAGHQAQSWVRLTARLDFTKQAWDLYANAHMVAADIPLINDTSTYLSTFQMQGDTIAASGLDDIFAGATNPLFADVNNNGIDDAWETAHGLSLTSDNRNTSPTGNGVTVLQAYLQGTDPADFYNGATPSLTIVGGNNQTAAPGQFNAEPFDVGVWNTAGTAPLVNAPVTFMVQSGGGLLALANTGTPTLTSTLSLTTDVNGTAQVYFQQPNTASVQSTITLTAGTGQLTFTTASTATAPTDSDGNGLPDAWETQYLGQIGNDPASDPGAVGRTLLQSYEEALSPWPAATVPAGLQAWYRADEGVIADNSNNVSQWTDVSGNGFHVAQINEPYLQPTVVAGAVNGQPAVQFDGSKLLKSSTIDLQNGSSDLTVIAVVNPQATQNFRAGIVTYGGEAGSFGLSQLDVQTNQYELWWNTANGYGYGNDQLVAALSGHAQVLTFTKAGLTQSAYFDGQLQGTGTATDQILTNPAILTVGGYYTTPGIGFNGQIAEVLIYNRALSDSERQQVEAALTAKYLPPSDPTSISGMRLWLEADAGVITDANGNVSAWQDQCGLNNSATQSDPTAQPGLVANQINGRPVIHFNGSAYLSLPDVMQGIDSGEIIAVVKMADNPDQRNTLWQFGVATGSGYYNGDSFDDFGPGNPNYFTAAPLAAAEQYHVYDAAADNGVSWQLRFNGVLEYSYTDGAYTAFNNSPVIGGSSLHDMLLKGDVAEILIYDHVLSQQERSAVNGYLTEKYLSPVSAIPAQPTLSAYALSDSSVQLTWSLPSSPNQNAIAEIERQVSGGDFTGIFAQGGATTFTDTGLTPGVTYSYRMKFLGDAGDSSYSDPITITTPFNDPSVPTTGLRLWLKASVGTEGIGPVSRWIDQSGQGNDAVQPVAYWQPSVVANQVNGLPAVHFTQDHQNSLSLPNLMAGATGGEAFVVLRKSPTANIVGLWAFGSFNGSRYPESTGEINDDFASNAWASTGAAPAGLTDFHIYNVGGDSTTWFQKFNAVTHFSQSANTVGFRENPTIGDGQGSNFDGDIAEVIVYDHVLNDADRLAVNLYLNGTYAIGIAFDTTPPTAPTIVGATAVTATSFVLSWTAATDNKGVSGYDVLQDGTVIGSTTALSFKVIGLSAAGSYGMTVRARDGSGNISIPSAPLSVATFSPLVSPTSVTATQVGAGSVSITWAAPPAGTGVAGYNIYVNGTYAGTTTTNSFTATGLVPTANQNITVASLDAAGNASANSDVFAVTTIDGSSTGAQQNWAIVTMPAGYEPVGVLKSPYGIGSATSLNLAAFFSTHIYNSGYRIFRWSQGNIDELVASAPSIGYSAQINNVGTIAINGDGFIDVFTLGSSTPRTLGVNNHFQGATLSGPNQNAEFSGSDRYYSSAWAPYNYHFVYLYGLSDDNRVWFDAFETVDIGQNFSAGGQEYRFADYGVLRSFYSGTNDTSETQVDPVPWQFVWPPAYFSSADNLWEYTTSAGQHPGLALDFAYSNGTYSGQKNGSYYVGTRAVDYRPLYINKNNTVLGQKTDTNTGLSTYLLEFNDANHTRQPLPGTNFVWVDDQDRPQGSVFLLQPRPGTFAPNIQYDSIGFKPVTPPLGWQTSLKAPPDAENMLTGMMTNISTNEQRAFLAIPAGIAVDANHDGIISLSSQGNFDNTSSSNPYRFWLNDDNDGSGDATNGDDIPGVAAADYLTPLNGGDMGVVHGVRDLIDWFPVALDIKQLLTVLPPSSTVKYKLKQADSAVNFVYTNLTRDQAFSYQRPAQNTAPLSSGFGPDLTQAADSAYKRQVTAAGVDLFNAPTGSAQFLDAIQNHNGGVILIEGRATSNAPLVLSVENNGNVVAEVKLYLSINGVETMFRHLNLHDRNLSGLVGTMNGGTAHQEAMGDPAGFPDNPNSDSRWLIFVHGFNVSGQASRAWNAEMFKRSYWSGNKSRFVGVSWFGNPDQVLGAVSDYHLSVRNAMITAPVLAQEINALAGAADTKTLFAHSLGCGVISSAIVDHGMTVGRVCFVDAALARECFDGRSPGTFTSENDGMTPAAWKAYDPKLYAANWFNLFDPTTDSRGKLTWINRFSGASSVVYHFYSSTEDVLAEYTGELPTSFALPGGVLWTGDHLGTFGWVYQEKGKGNRQNYLINVETLTELTHLGSYYGGWGTNLKDPLLDTDPVYWKWDNTLHIRVFKSPGEVGTIDDAILRRNPVFEPGWGVAGGQNRLSPPNSDPANNVGPSWILNLYGSAQGTGTQGNTLAGDPSNRAQLLAEAIPSLTWCIGSRAVTRFEDRNFNLPTLVNQTNWPRGKPDGVTPEWRHSDMREVAYLYQYGVFDKIVALSKP